MDKNTFLRNKALQNNIVVNTPSIVEEVINTKPKLDETIKENMKKLLINLPNINRYPLEYVFENLKLTHKKDTLWLEFGVATGTTINYFSNFTNDTVYGFDCFEGLPENWGSRFKKGFFSLNGKLPNVNKNVKLVKGLFEDTLVDFLNEHNQKISFIHIDCDIYSATKFILDTVKDKLAEDCIIIFDELVNYVGYDEYDSELHAFYNFLLENKVDYEWIGMNGTVDKSLYDHIHHMNAALKIRSINS